MSARKPKIKTSLPWLKTVGRFLALIGAPVLFFLKILVWTLTWFVRQSINFGQAILDLGEGLIRLLKWFYQIVVANTETGWPIFKKYLLSKRKYWQKKSLDILVTTQKYHTTLVKNLPRQKLKFNIPKFPNLPKFPKSKWPKILRHQKLYYFTAGALAVFLLIFIPYWGLSQLDQLPNPQLLTLRDIPVSTKIYDRNGNLLYQIYSGENRVMVNLSDLPKYFVQATIATEDKNFYHHFGFDPAGILRAALSNQNGEINQGGSTITQQLVRSALLTPEKTVSRKTKELILSFWAERIYSKKEILTMYFNQIPYGGAAYGVEAAAQMYFKKPAKDLSLAQATLLAGLPSSPTTYSPFGSHPELAKQRQRLVLDAMVAQKYLSREEADAAFTAPLEFASTETAIKAPHFVMYVKDLLAKKYGLRKIEQGGLEVVTTLDLSLYEKILKIVADGVANQKYLSVGNGAALVTNPKAGEILAMVGSTDFFDLTRDGNVNVTLASRSPGSSIKPLNYALALNKNLISPSTIIDDSPIVYRSGGTAVYAPQNYDNKFHGKVTVRTALASSYNIPAVKILEKNGLENFLDFAHQTGIKSFSDPSRYGLSITLGGGEVTMLEMATAYSMFANGGEKVDLNPILKITDYRGRVLENNTSNRYLLTANRSSLISPQTAFLISDILADNGARSPAFGPSSALVIPGHTVSVKTGTAQDKRYNWTIGYTPSFLAAVWVGNNNNAPMSMALESGNTGAAAIWNPIMKTILEGKTDEGLARPDNIVPVQVCTLNGLLPCEFCPYVRTEYFVKGTEPKFACTFTKEEVEKILRPEEKKEEKKN